MQTHAYSSPALKPAGAIIDMTATAHIDRGSPEPGTTFDPMSQIFSSGSPEPGDTMGQSPMFRSPEPLGTKMSIVNLQGLKPSAHIDHNSPEPAGTVPLSPMFRSPEPGNTTA